MKSHKTRFGMVRLTATALVLAMLLTVMPAAAFADPEPVSPEDSTVQTVDPQPAAEPEAPAAEPEAPAEEPEAPAEEPEAPAEAPADEAAAPADEAAAPAEEPAAPAEEPAAEPEEAPTPAIRQELKVGKLIVTIDAEAGAFPEGTKVKAKKVDLKDIQKAVDASENVDGEVLVAVDITFTLKGKEVQPAEGKSVKVNISAPELKNKAGKVRVVHIDDETKEPELVKEVKAPELDEVSFDAPSFSVYAVFEPPYEGPTARVQVNFYGYDGVEPGEGEGEDGTLKYKLIHTYWVKNADDAAQIAMNVIDPGIGDLGDMKDKIVFRGWSLDKLMDGEGNQYPQDPEDSTEYVGPDYEPDFEAMSIEDVRTYLEGLTIHEGDVLNVYAVLYEFYHVTYYGDYDAGLGDDNVSLGKQTVFRLVGHDEAPYEINMGYSSTDTNRNFKGWKPLEGGDKIDPPLSAAKEFYENGEDVQITGDVKFVAEAPEGVWLVYHANGKGATYNAPQFYEGSDGNWPTTTPAENATADKMVRKGYDFVGWYYSKLVDGTLVIDETRPFTFGQEISEDTDIFAKWKEKTEASYTVVCYIQRADDPSKYDIADTQVFNAAENAANGIHVHDNIPYTSVENGQEDYATGAGTKVVDGETIQKGHYTGFCLTEGSKGQTVEITADGEAILELYFDRVTYNFKFYLYRQAGSYAPKYEYSYTVYNGNPSNHTQRWGVDDNGEYFEVYWTGTGGNRRWRVSDSNNAAPYTGTVYDRTSVQVGTEFTPSPGASYTYANNSGNGESLNNLVSWNNASANHPTISDAYAQKLGLEYNEETQSYLSYEEHTFDNTLYRYYYFTITAKYEEEIDDLWPRYDTDIIGADGRGPVSFVMMVGTKLKPNATNSGSGTVKGVITVLNENILGATNDEDGNYVIVRFPQNGYNNWRYHIWYEVLDGKDINGDTVDPSRIVDYGGKSYYEEEVVVVRSSNLEVSSQNEPKFDGFDFVAKKGQDWNAANPTYWTTTEGGTNYYHLNYLYGRQMFKVTYYDGQYVDGDDNDIVNKASRYLKTGEDIPVGADISDCENYDPSAENEPGPTEPGFVFEGWYLDETCEHPYEFDTMPLGGVVVFAKWRQIQYRVFLRPNATIEQNGETVDDANLSWGDESMGDTEKQSLCFRISYGGTISTPDGVRKGYIFRGWYKDPGFTQVYSSKTELNEDTVKTAYDKATDMTDIMDKFGNIVDNGATYYVSNQELVANKDPYNSDDDDHNARWWITKKLDLYARWQKILEGAQGVSVDYDAVEGEGSFSGGETIYHDPLPYEDNSNAVAASAPTPLDTDTQQFLYWVVQKWNGTAYEDAKDADGQLITTYPGDDLKVLASYAKITEEGSDVPVDPSNVQQGGHYVYTMQVRAEYGPIEIPKNTYFNYYRNYQEDDGKTGTAAVEAATIYQETNLQINQAVDIYTITGGVPTREGYTFKGWGRENEYATDPPAKDEDGNIIDDPVLYYQNPTMYLRWNQPAEGDDAEGYYDAYNDKSGEWEPVTQVAADEFTPYQALYAVWEKRPSFTVNYYYNTASTEEIDHTETVYLDELEGTTYDIINGTSDHPGLDVATYLYGGYQKVVNTSRQYQTVPGSAITPTEDAVYYVKMVPLSDVYLKPFLQYLQKAKAPKTATDVWVFSSIDDLMYKETGFILNNVLENQVTNEQTASINSSVDIKNNKGKVVATITRAYAFVGTSQTINPKGYITYVELPKAEGAYAYPNGTSFEITPYWKTYDGVEVLGEKKKIISFGANGVLSGNQNVDVPRAAY